MDETYSDLVRYQVELEEKNSALEDAQGFLRGVLAAMTDVLIVGDRNGAILQVNKALEEIVGEREAQLQGRPVEALLTADCRPLMDVLLSQVESGAVSDCEISIDGVGGPVPLTINCSSRTDHRGRLIGIVLIGRPLGELRAAYRSLRAAHVELQQAQQQLVSAEKMASLGRLVAGVAHELNNPISFIYGNIHALAGYGDRLTEYIAAVDAAQPSADVAALRDELRVPHILADLKSLIEGTLEGAERVRDLVQDLRHFSSGQQGEKTKLDLVHIIGTALHWVTKQEREPPAIDCHAPEQLEVTGHPGQIQQVLMNLIQNALDATRGNADAKIWVRVAANADHAEISVRDNGPGIPEENLMRVFDPFFTTKPVGEGTGLGLSISYGIVRDHGGSLTAGNHPSGGAIFMLTLPTCED